MQGSTDPSTTTTLTALAWLAGAAGIGMALHALAYAVALAALRGGAAAEEDDHDRDRRAELGAAVRRTRLPAALVVPLAAVLVALPWVAGTGELAEPLHRAIAVALIAATTWLVARTIAAGAHYLLGAYDVGVRDNLRARKIHTQWRVITRIALFAVWTVGVAAILMTFPSIRQLGTSVLASAGLAGLILGLAAQRTIGNFLAGLQIAITQPLRLEDAVVIAGEWGWIEEITATYVVVKIWDERRLIVPFSTLLEQPFQNWTRSTSDLIGTVVVWTDYTVPVQAVREELQRVVEASDLWDGRVAVLQVVDATERGLQLRALVSAADSPKAWDLRCHVREKLIDHLQRTHPGALPRVRAILSRSEGPPADASDEVALGGLPGAPPIAGEPG